MPVNRRLGRHVKPTAFGLGMYQLERDSAIVIARAGQARALKDHTFAARAPQLDDIVRRALAKRAA
jgi:hypothetical protein